MTQHGEVVSANDVVQVVVQGALMPGLTQWLHQQGLYLMEMPAGTDELRTFVVGVSDVTWLRPTDGDRRG